MTCRASFPAEAAHQNCDLGRRGGGGASALLLPLLAGPDVSHMMNGAVMIVSNARRAVLAGLRRVGQPPALHAFDFVFSR